MLRKSLIRVRQRNLFGATFDHGHAGGQFCIAYHARTGVNAGDAAGIAQNVRALFSDQSVPMPTSSMRMRVADRRVPASCGDRTGRCETEDVFDAVIIGSVLLNCSPTQLRRSSSRHSTR